VDSTSPAETKRRQEIERKIDDWWAEFTRSTVRIANLFSRKEKWDLATWMQSHLGAIEPRLMWEFGPAVRGKGHRLVITPESAKHLRPLTDAILARAPRINAWEFYPYRLPEDLAQVEFTVQGRTGGDLSGVMALAAIGEHNLIDLVYYSTRAVDSQDEQANRDALVATESLLGEERLDKWIGAITVEPLQARKMAGLVSLGQLPERVAALIGQVKDQMPDEPCLHWVETASWTLFKLQPKEADDYPGQFDLLIRKAAHVPMWKAAHSRALFCSERFSKHNETFCYVKLDGIEGLDEEKFADKSEIEDALDAVLKPAKLGCHVGGGTGLRYSYIDLALLDVTRGIATVRERLQQGNVPKRSWIIFYDDYLSAEWVGIYDDSPPPPMPDFE
jgi:hypothetical protein